MERQTEKDFDYAPSCLNCGDGLIWHECEDCEEGFSYHDCGEDTCCCIDPQPNVVCDTCEGDGGWWECLSCKKCYSEKEAVCYDSSHKQVL